MSRMTHAPGAPAVAAEHPLAKAGRLIVRYALVVVIAWIGALKYTAYEAKGIQPLIHNSPLLSWLYNIFSVRTFAAVLGTFEIIAALLIALWLLWPRISALGSAMGRAAVPRHAELPVHHARGYRCRRRRIAGAVGAARPVPAQGPGADRRRAVDAGRLARHRPEQGELGRLERTAAAAAAGRGRRCGAAQGPGAPPCIARTTWAGNPLLPGPTGRPPLPGSRTARGVTFVIRASARPWIGLAASGSTGNRVIRA